MCLHLTHPQAIPPLEFMYKGDRISLAFVEATIHSPTIGKGGVSRDLRVFPAECRGRRCTYRGKLVVGFTILSVLQFCTRPNCWQLEQASVVGWVDMTSLVVHNAFGFVSSGRC